MALNTGSEIITLATTSAIIQKLASEEKRKKREWVIFLHDNSLAAVWLKRNYLLV